MEVDSLVGLVELRVGVRIVVVVVHDAVVRHLTVAGRHAVEVVGVIEVLVKNVWALVHVVLILDLLEPGLVVLLLLVREVVLRKVGLVLADVLPVLIVGLDVVLLVKVDLAVAVEVHLVGVVR